MALVSDAVALACVLARRAEGFRPSPYLDMAGVPTIGYGFTRYASGQIVSLADPPILQPAAETLLEQLMASTAVRVLVMCPAATEPGRLAALTDFAYNLGLGRLQSSTLLRLARSGRWGETPVEFRKWRYAGGKIALGLVRRREAEIELLNN